MGKGEQGEEGEKEGSYLLGDPTFVEIGGGRWRCVETGQEMPEKEKEGYSKCKACRVGLIDAAVAKRKPPLNTFEQHPVSKSQLICKLTGDTVNKTEEQIWKHINGRRFNYKLEQMELQANSPPPVEAVKEKKKSKKLKKDKKKKNKKINDSENVDGTKGSEEKEETEFWMPPVGERWDFDDGKDRWESCENTDPNEESGSNSAGAGADGAMEESESSELTASTKRLSIAIGPSSFASRKKKVKREAQADQNGS